MALQRWAQRKISSISKPSLQSQVRFIESGFVPKFVLKCIIKIKNYEAFMFSCHTRDYDYVTEVNRTRNVNCSQNVIITKVSKVINGGYCSKWFLRVWFGRSFFPHVINGCDSDPPLLTKAPAVKSLVKHTSWDQGTVSQMWQYGDFMSDCTANRRHLFLVIFL